MFREMSTNFLLVISSVGISVNRDVEQGRVESFIRESESQFGKRKCPRALRFMPRWLLSSSKAHSR